MELHEKVLLIVLLVLFLGLYYDFCLAPPLRRWRRKRTMTDQLDRFWTHVKLSETCWEWTGYLDKDGYGRFHDEKGRSVAAHKWIYEYYNGPLPRGEVARHTCDNRKCVRPDHLVSGTQRDNIQDMIDRGRKPPPSSNRLTSEQVFDLRKMYWYDLLTERDLVEITGIDRSVVARVARGETYTNVHPLCDRPATHYVIGDHGYLLPFCEAHAQKFAEIRGKTVFELSTEHRSGSCYYIEE